ncbi:regucalcin-like [Macrosteles quadrilineatus]|uniref:regucalcin-like n=1 Tax=Macrosteles quadrilineatus TaxID=74068 RepID=UPI0023E1D84E|nr:regucalcin-like [Macrosteles quadrilineatus]
MDILYVLLVIVMDAYILPAVKASNTDYKISTVSSNVVGGFTGGLYWDGEHNRLYWLEIGHGDDPTSIVCYDPNTEKTYKATIIGDKLRPLSMVIRVKGTQDTFLIGVGGALALIRWDCTSDRDINPVEIFRLEDMRFIYGKADAEGSLWAGTLKSGPKPSWYNPRRYSYASIYKIDEGKQSKRITSGEDMMDGFEWSLNNKKFYFMDSWSRKMYAYQYDSGRKKLSSENVMVRTYTEDGPSHKISKYISGYGITIDNNGHLWIPGNGLGKIFQIDSKFPGSWSRLLTIKTEIALADMWPTSVCFGGKDLDILFVTTTHFDWTKDRQEMYPKSGNTFMITGLGVTGARPSSPVKISNDLLKKCC